MVNFVVGFFVLYHPVDLVFTNLEIKKHFHAIERGIVIPQGYGRAEFGTGAQHSVRGLYLHTNSIGVVF